MTNPRHDGQDNTKKEYNVFRDSLLRYMGYANEIGESFRYQYPKLVTPSYVLAFGYCGLDALTAGWKELKNSSDITENKMAVIAATADTLLWQTFASVLIPGGTINIIVRVSRFAVSKIALNPALKKWSPTGFGLFSIPLIVQPIDEFVDFTLDNTTRKWI